jgi:hypothetical protein
MERIAAFDLLLRFVEMRSEALQGHKMVCIERPCLGKVRWAGQWRIGGHLVATELAVFTLEL